MSRVALQLWTIREECERDLAHAVGRVGAAGYDGVELFQLHGLDARELRTLLDDNGLAVAGRHAGLASIEHDLPSLAAEAEVLGTERLAISWIDPETLASPEAVLGRVRAAAEAAREAGLRLGFHNHWTEPAPLAGGSSFLDLLRELPHDLLWLELDLGWVWQAGADPAEELARTRGRCPLVHLKDYASRDGRDDVPVGDGVVGYAELIRSAVAAGAEWLVVEEDDAGPDPFVAAERSLAFVREHA
jgi:sugar phosphate isomerase/epimerase